MLLSTTSRIAWATAHMHMSAAGSPILVEANDVTLLALITPMSLSLLFDRQPNIVRALALLSIVVSTWLVVILQSRTAAVTRSCASGLQLVSWDSGGDERLRSQLHLPALLSC